MSQTATQARQKLYRPVPQAKRARGRQSDFVPEIIAEAEELCEVGYTDQELADHFNIALVTWYRWQKRHPELRQAIVRGKDVLDDRVEASLFKRATGFTFKSEKVFCNADGVHRVPTREYVPPDVAAAKHWLGNRRRGVWTDTQVIDLQGQLQVENTTDRDIALTLVQLLRTAGAEALSEVLPTIEHQPAPAATPAARERVFG